MSPKATPPSPRHRYDESKIKTLSSLEHIRKRTGMYIGRIGDGQHYDDGVYVLLKEVIDNAIDEFIMGYGTTIRVDIDGTEVTIRDHGRGIPLGKVVECVSQINTGAKYNDDVFQFSVGLNGVGTKAVNALSKRFHVRSVRDGSYSEASFKRGEITGKKRGRCRGEENGTLVTFSPDADIFGDVRYDEELVQRRIRFYTYLNAGLTIEYNGQEWRSEGGLLDLVSADVKRDAVYPVLHFRDKTLEIALTHTNRFSESYFSFVNGQYTVDGGIHLSAFREGLLKAVNDYSRKRFDGDDVRDGVVGAIAIRLKDPIFESQTKNKLGNTEIRGSLVGTIREAIVDLFHRHPDSADRLIRKVEETQKIRKELQAVKKLAREKARATSIRVPQLKDCKIHRTDSAKKRRDRESMIFIAEGQSAAGSMVQCRDVNTQAIFTLKGKPLNVCDLNRDAVYKNDELYNLMRALDIEGSVDNLRYDKVVLATDADVDGLHIRNLALTFFLRFFEPLVLGGHVFILETPLFRVRNRKETHYCYSEEERDSAIKKLSRGIEITRFKGLGEISPHEFKQFIGDDMRLTPVVVGDHSGIPKLLQFYMGRNTPERRGYIMNHLVVEASA
ncbi:MAG: toprim domain-containing protein [Acidobacteriota bacterium]|nr:toprim domain-containing protein [Acidobacteriota bacterium]MDH3784013.1 toprim domain-containing protein [Acidobacteriota bacterium]